MAEPSALYRRYRPESFAEVIGQEHVTEPLSRALTTRRINHAYLFSGPRGCGKTTSARILARCLNCAEGPTATPCGVCDSCAELARGGPGSLDVVEIDAASHGGVDDARELRERATMSTARDRYKVYIIDEAHMVTPQGFNALLKLVEEPPEHVMFVFATTEPDKVLPTIRSRTHHYPFHLVPPHALTQYLAGLCEQEGVAVGKGVLPLVVRAGGGSVRDSLSVLDQLMSGAGDAGVDYARAAALLGYTDSTLLDGVVGAVEAADGATLFTVVDRVIESGHDPRRFVEDLLERLRDLIVVQALGDRAGGVLRALPADQLERMALQSATLGAASLSRAADIVNDSLTDMVGASSPRMHLELLCARLLLPAADPGTRGLGARIDRLERRLDAPAAAQPAAQAPRSRSLPDVGPGQTNPAATDPAAPTTHTLNAPTRDQPSPMAPGLAGSGLAPAPQAPQAPPVAERPPVTRDARDGDRPGRAAAPAGPAEAPGRAAVEPDVIPPAAAARPVERQPPAPAPPPTPAGAIDTAAVRGAWADILERIRQDTRFTWMLLRDNAHVDQYADGRLRLAFSSAAAAGGFAAKQHAEAVKRAFADELALVVRVEAVVAEGPAPVGPGQPGAADEPDPPLPPEPVDEPPPPAPDAAAGAASWPQTRAVGHGRPQAAPPADRAASGTEGAGGRRSAQSGEGSVGVGQRGGGGGPRQRAP
ncbi:MAG TPA: DNA polymerase III subunit gamma and tau, partial [Mycobacteriales bacterium]|nr:DNA polymerase III subunit gamma and tau [Mycobacteriales bacterium]